MLEIGKLFFWQTWAKLEASEEIADRFHELIPDMALEFPFELDAFQKEVFTLLIIFLLVTQVLRDYTQYHTIEATNIGI